MNRSRKSIKRSTVRRLEQYFGGKRCVIRGDLSERATWHHVNDDITDPRFENLIPLRWGFNRDLGALAKQRRALGANGGPMLPYSSVLSPEALSSQARLHYWNWDGAAHSDVRV